jgi:hypothetical protein
VDGPWPNDAVTCAYETLCRLTSRAIVASWRGAAFDALGRSTLLTNATAERTKTNARGWTGGSKDFGKADQRSSQYQELTLFWKTQKLSSYVP